MCGLSLFKSAWFFGSLYYIIMVGKLTSHMSLKFVFRLCGISFDSLRIFFNIYQYRWGNLFLVTIKTIIFSNKSCKSFLWRTLLSCVEGRNSNSKMREKLSINSQVAVLYFIFSKAFDFYVFQQVDVRSKEDWLGSSFSRSSNNKMVDAVLNKFPVTLTRFSGWK